MGLPLVYGWTKITITPDNRCTCQKPNPDLQGLQYTVPGEGIRATKLYNCLSCTKVVVVEVEQV
jgi:hypothetical protein